MEKDVQLLTNRMGRSSLGVRKTTAIGIVTTESALPPARALLDHRQARFALRLLARPQGGGGQEEILLRNSSLAARIKERCGLSRRETAELQGWEEFRQLKGTVVVNSKEEAFRVAEEWDDQFSTVWTDGSRLSGGEVGAAIAFWTGKGWVKRGTYLGQNKEVFNAEVFAILQGVKLLNERAEAGRHYTLFSDSQVAILRIRHDRSGPAQALAKAVITTVDELDKAGNTLCIRWTPTHRGVEGNEQADQTAKSAAEGKEERAEQAYLMQASLSYLTRKTTETRS